MDDDDIQFDPDLPITQPENNNNNAHAHHAQNNNRQNPEDALSPLEQEVLDEYARLVGNLDDLAGVLNDLASRPSAEILDALRGLERKTSTVFTLLKASVYSIVLQQEVGGG
ncbi:hypothetical protein M409DRAFT_23804 [Zasmidium cellare ATCC 36951]|uniref:DASH complex subunit DAD3 n=1 Tax=Zasmidium cellare ATCC 36951 TaxID=1080233 RepID=A0A6A6CKY0_ZASCE|nr:uncharacterized protein M409DRAFT_23804 [Zasmidium cellare ATCC 36951]KAF2166076.1 hypothetical protein M409DRAFT_23804 [Zasmidium cellare ATCC 36951]